MKSLQTIKKVKIAGKTVDVKKLPLGKIAELLQSIEELPKELSGLDKMSNEQALSKLPFLIGASIPAFAPMVVKAVENQITKEELMENAGLDEVIDLVTVFCEINNVFGIIAKAKKIKALAQPGARKK